MRISQLERADTRTRWDTAFIRKQLEKLGQEYGESSFGKVWVCGPPNMSETFEKAFTSFLDEKFLGLQKSQLNVL